MLTPTDNSKTISIGLLKLHYHIYGSGNKVMFAFHGFGQNSGHFSEFSHIVQEKYTVYAIDLFFHGKSFWPDDKLPLEKNLWGEIFLKLLENEKIDSFSLMGYSLGAKFVFATLEIFEKRVERIILIAPDGIKTNFWYTIATYPILLRKLFKSFIKNPRPLFRLLKIFKALKIIDNGNAKFVNQQMNTVKKRKRVYYCWTVFRHLNFNSKNLSQLINKNNIFVLALLGKYDRIISKRKVMPLLKQLKQYHLEIIKSGHTNLIHDAKNYFEKSGDL